jgi:hypothetical protein
MSEVHVEIVVVNPRTSARSEPVVALADTGATLTVMPGELLGRLGVEKRDIEVALDYWQDYKRRR